MNSMADSRRSEKNDEYLESKIKSCQPIRTNTDVKRLFQESAWKLL